MNREVNIYTTCPRCGFERAGRSLNQLHIYSHDYYECYCGLCNHEWTELVDKTYMKSLVGII